MPRNIARSRITSNGEVVGDRGVWPNEEIFFDMGKRYQETLFELREKYMEEHC
jgi:hypothetical protein